MSDQKIAIDEIYKSLLHQINSLSPEEAVDLYCHLNEKWGVVEYNNDGVALALIKDKYR